MDTYHKSLDYIESINALRNYSENDIVKYILLYNDMFNKAEDYIREKYNHKYDKTDNYSIELYGIYISNNYNDDPDVKNTKNIYDQELPNETLQFIKRWFSLFKNGEIKENINVLLLFDGGHYEDFVCDYFELNHPEDAKLIKNKTSRFLNCLEKNDEYEIVKNDMMDFYSDNRTSDDIVEKLIYDVENTENLESYLSYPNFSIDSYVLTYFDFVLNDYDKLRMALISLMTFEECGYDIYFSPEKKLERIDNSIYQIETKIIEKDFKAWDNFFQENKNTKEKFKEFIKSVDATIDMIKECQPSRQVINYYISKLKELCDKYDFNYPNMDDIKDNDTKYSYLDMNAVDKMTGIEFEGYCVSLLEKNGFHDIDTTKTVGDQGVDIIAIKNDIRYAIQCKCYSQDLGNTPIQEVAAGTKYYNCHVGVVMTNRYFTDGAIKLAQANNILLWDRDKLLEMNNKNN